MVQRVAGALLLGQRAARARGARVDGARERIRVDPRGAGGGDEGAAWGEKSRAELGQPRVGVQRARHVVPRVGERGRFIPGSNVVRPLVR